MSEKQELGHSGDGDGRRGRGWCASGGAAVGGKRAREGAVLTHDFGEGERRSCRADCRVGQRRGRDFARICGVLMRFENYFATGMRWGDWIAGNSAENFCRAA